MAEMRRRALPAWAAVALVAGSAAVSWCLSSHDAYPAEYADCLIGPYRVPVLWEYVAGAVAVAAMLAVAVVRPVSPRGRGLAWSTVVLLVLAGLLATLSWRVITAGGGGANIGGAAAMLTSPFLVAGLLVGAVFTEQSARRQQLRWLGPWLVLAASPAVVGVMIWTW